MAGMGGQPYFLGVPVPHDPPSTAVGSMQGYNASFDAERVRKATKVSYQVSIHQW